MSESEEDHLISAVAKAYINERKNVSFGPSKIEENYRKIRLTDDEYWVYLEFLNKVAKRQDEIRKTLPLVGN
tara:strand:+ start:1324 stop:1539 length:216 start_codon:yes stop_codon:yes gene_type:complete